MLVAPSDTAAETVLRGRLGQELARLYGDTLDAPIPSTLANLIDRLSHAVKDGSKDRDE